MLISLPNEIIRNHIIRAHIGTKPTPLVLIMRSTCRRFREAIPAWELLKLQKETMQWLFDGETEVWTKEKNTPEWGVLFPNDFFYTEDPHKNPLAINSEKSNCLSNEAVVRIGKSEIRFMSLIHEQAYMYSESGDLTLRKTDINCAAVLSIDNKFFVLSNSAELFCINPIAKYANALPLIDQTTDTIQKFAIPEGFIYASTLRIKHFRTNNQKDFWILTFHNILAHANVSDANSLRIIAKDVMSIFLLDEAVLCITLDKKLKLITLHNATPYTVFIMNATSMQPIMSLKSIWFCTQDGVVHRRGAKLKANPTLPTPTRALDVNRLHFTATILFASIKSLHTELKDALKDLADSMA